MWRFRLSSLGARAAMPPLAAVASSSTARWQSSAPGSRFTAPPVPPKQLSSDINRVVGGAQSNANAAADFAALPVSAASLDHGAFIAAVRASVALRSDAHLDAIAEYAQRLGAAVPAAAVGDLCALLDQYPSMPKAQVLLGLLAQRVVAAVGEMAADTAAVALSVFTRAGPLGDHVVQAAAARLRVLAPDAAAADMLRVAETLIRSGPARVPELPPAVADRLRELLIASASGSTDEDAAAQLQRRVELVRIAAHPLFADEAMRSAAADVVRAAFTSEALVGLPPRAVIAAAATVAKTAQLVTETTPSSTVLSSATREILAGAVAGISAAELEACERADVLGVASAAAAAVPPVELPAAQEWMSSVREALRAADPQQRRSARDIAQFVVPPVLESETDLQRVAGLIDGWHEGWSAADWAIVLDAVAAAGSENGAARDILRRRSNAVAHTLSSANSADLAVIARAAADLHVRVMSLSSAIADRCVAVKDAADPSDLTTVLVALTRVDARIPKPFLESVTAVRRNTAGLSAKDAAATALAYARHNVWLYKVYARLADRLCEVAYEWTVTDIKRALAALHRVGVKHERFTELVVARITRDFDELPFTEAVALATAATKFGGWDAAMFEKLEAAAIARESELDATLLGDILLCFSRVGYPNASIFEKLVLRAIAVAPQAEPLAIANVLTAYASMRIANEELFTVYGERTLQLKDECPAVTIAAVLTAVSTVGLKDDRLFIEMIPRVRFVAHHGSPQDVANVLTAYTSVGLWHYKLFVKLAERAIQVRAECSAEQIAQIVFAFAKVEMKYEKLFFDFSPRIQVIAATASPSQLALIAHGYAAVKCYDAGVMSAIAERAAQVVGEFREEEARMLLLAFVRLSMKQPTLFEAFKNRFESLEGIENGGTASQPAAEGTSTSGEQAAPAEGSGQQAAEEGPGAEKAAG